MIASPMQWPWGTVTPKLWVLSDRCLAKPSAYCCSLADSLLDPEQPATTPMASTTARASRARDRRLRIAGR